MKWYWVLLIVAVVQAIGLLVLWLLTRSKLSSWAGELHRSLLSSSETRATEELAAERKAREKTEAELQALAEEYKRVAAWYTDNKDRIDDEAKQAFSDLVGDPAALDRKLDELLPTTATDRTSPPGEG